MRTPFTDLVGCDVPIQLSPMGGVAVPDLVVAVAAAGAMGATSMPMAPAAAVAGVLDVIRRGTDGPVAFNIAIPLLDLEVVEVAAVRSKLVDFYHGAVDPALVARVHDAGALAGWQVGDVDDARAACDAGCDLIVARGIEGGGRSYGDHELRPLLDAVVEVATVPVLAAGGISDGAGLVAALDAGAAGARLGTRFIAAAESGAHPAYKAAVIAATADDSVLTDAFGVGWPSDERTSRVLRGSLERAQALPDGAIVGHLAAGGETIEIPRFAPVPPGAGVEGDVAAMPMYAGRSVAGVTREQPAADIVREIMREAEAVTR
jgi:nitronate monooxygenase